MIETLLAAAIGFALGSIPFSLLMGRIFGGVDIRKAGSGNVGATNVARTAGWGPGLLALLLDAAKGAAAVLLARLCCPGAPAADLVAGGMAVLGHLVSPFLRFRGGKGVATGAGVFLVLAPGALCVAALVFAVTVALSRYVSLASVGAAIAMPVAAFLLGLRGGITLLALVVAVAVIARHRGNLARLRAGKERRLGERRRSDRRKAEASR
ncbi:MAG TPA: glycerol-3-phosphate 1-O-acyltransferase PlsY [Dongiaceae bacterium]|nr:glycerol-3-phosphate 1-O-acyltransferase PlsY [Dongiaceae bacterium]